MNLLPALSVGTLLACLALIAVIMLYRRDEQLEAGMTQERHPVRDDLRRYLGIDDILTQLHRMENAMTSATAQLTQLKAQFSDFASDVNAKLDQLNTAQGDFTPEAQAVFDEIKQAVSDADTSVGDADGSDTTVPVDPTS